MKTFAQNAANPVASGFLPIRRCNRQLLWLGPGGALLWCAMLLALAGCQLTNPANCGFGAGQPFPGQSISAQPNPGQSNSGLGQTSPGQRTNFRFPPEADASPLAPNSSEQTTSANLTVRGQSPTNTYPSTNTTNRYLPTGPQGSSAISGSTIPYTNGPYTNGSGGATARPVQYQIQNQPPQQPTYSGQTLPPTNYAQPGYPQQTYPQQTYPQQSMPGAVPNGAVGAPMSPYQPSSPIQNQYGQIPAQPSAPGTVQPLTISPQFNPQSTPTQAYPPNTYSTNQLPQSAVGTSPQYGQPYGQQPYGAQPYNTQPNNTTMPPSIGYGGAGTYAPGSIPPSAVAPGATGVLNGTMSPNSMLAPGAVPPGVDPTTGLSFNSPYEPIVREAPIDVYVTEGRTGRIVLGGSVNSDLGVGGQVIIDERNFDYRRLPTSWGDLFAGKAFRGDGQLFRAELMPGNRVQRYTVNFTQPHLFGYSPISFSVGGFLYTRQFRDWTEQRLGGRLALGYDITRDLSISTELNLQDVKVFDPRVGTVPELNSALGSNDLYTGRIRLAHDTRDSPFMATEGHYLELMYDQVFGEYDYPRGQLNYSRYFLVRERADGGGRHTFAWTSRAGISGADTPIFENFFMGGYSTLRGFSFRGASPVTNDVQVGGRLQFLGSAEYLFPLTADDMLRGIFFVDYGAIARDLDLSWDDYRIAPGFGVRINVPALGPAPLAFDFAFPVKYDDSDDRQVMSFFMGFTR